MATVARQLSAMFVLGLVLLCPMLAAATGAGATADAQSSATARADSGGIANAKALASAAAEAANRGTAIASAQASASASASGGNGNKGKDLFCRINAWHCQKTCGHSCCHLQLDKPSKAFCDNPPQGIHTKFCPCSGEGPHSDPIFTDFQNRTFEFFGHPNATYNLLTHDTARVNMRLALAGDRHIRLPTQIKGIGTFTDLLAFAMPDNAEIVVEANEQGWMSVSVNHDDMDLDQPFEKDFGKTRISFDPFTTDAGEQLIIASDMFTFTVTAVQAVEDQVSGYSRGHLDMSTVIKVHPGQLEGILGSSLYVAPMDKLRHPEDMAFYDEGNEDQYIVNELYGGLQLRPSTSRRRLIEGTLPTLSFPIVGSMHSSL